MDFTTKQDDEFPTYAHPLQVPSVQEMVIKDPLRVPERYIRSDEDIQKTLYRYQLSSEVPIIDMSLLSKGNNEELIKLDLACKKWGFFQVVNHGVAREVLHGMKDASVRFFELPLKEKNKISMPPDDIQGYGHAFMVSEDQILDWSDALILLVYLPRFRKLSICPTEPDGFKEAIEAYSTELKRVAEELLDSLSLLMGMDKSSLLELHKELSQALRVNYYPPCRKPDKVLGVNLHSATSSITILVQDDDVTGLQIRHQEGWMPVEPVPNALVINVGDVIQILSNGKYKRVEHRAVTNESKTRLSYATFFIPRDDVEIEPHDQVIESQGSLPMYRKVIYGDYVRQSMKMKHDVKAHTQMAKT